MAGGSPFGDDLVQRAAALLDGYRACGWMIATAESCTGGLIAGLLTEIAGSSAVFDRGFATYSNAAKAEMIGVPVDLLERHGAVSMPVALSMAEGALARSQAHVAVAVTGIAGPGGGSAEKPVGLVHFGLAGRDAASTHVEQRFGNLGRAEIRRRSVMQALDLLDAALRS